MQPFDLQDPELPQSAVPDVIYCYDGYILLFFDVINGSRMVAYDTYTSKTTKYLLDEHAISFYNSPTGKLLIYSWKNQLWEFSRKGRLVKGDDAARLKGWIYSGMIDNVVVDNDGSTYTFYHQKVVRLKNGAAFLGNDTITTAHNPGFKFSYAKDVLCSSAYLFARFPNGFIIYDKHTLKKLYEYLGVDIPIVYLVKDHFVVLQSGTGKLTPNEKLFQIQPFPYTGITGNIKTYINEPGGNRILIAAEKGLFELTPNAAPGSNTGKNEFLTSFFKDKSVRCIYRLSSGKLYAGTYKGLYVADGDSARLLATLAIYTITQIDENTLLSVTVTPTTTDPNATVTVDAATVTSGTASSPIALAVGNTVIPTVVTAQDGVTTTTYTITVTRAPSSNAALGNLAISGGTLNPGFAGATNSYTASVANGITSITVTPTTADPTATVTVDGVAVASGTASNPITLSPGSNAITVVVTSQAGNKLIYTITMFGPVSTLSTLSSLTISAGTLSPAFSGSTTSYTDNVNYSVSAVTVTPTTSDPNATVTVNGTAVTSGTASGSIGLAVGNTTIPTVVTAQDGVTTTTYTITVTRAAASGNARLAGLALRSGTLSPGFATATNSYTASVTNATASIKVTPTAAVTGATIKVNGTAVASGVASAAITLAVGSNTITTVVTAQDGVTTDSYTLVVTRTAAGENTPDDAISVDKPTETPQLADDGINIHQGVSPNGDGINDFLQIDNISNYPDNKLSIMNRNGQLVYEAKGYDNATKTFDGHSNKTGQMQLPGTYFYSLDYTVKGIVKRKTGFLVLKY